ncbi:hypothetical protein ACUN7V_03835 [Quadrisphaera oryzae]|uniref:hypothetical protein n=1 Tax=Quadrisphaera oryzae TaxID=2509661 RepID=UPI0040450E65
MIKMRFRTVDLAVVTDIAQESGHTGLFCRACDGTRTAAIRVDGGGATAEQRTTLANLRLFYSRRGTPHPLLGPASPADLERLHLDDASSGTGTPAVGPASWHQLQVSCLGWSRRPEPPPPSR